MRFLIRRIAAGVNTSFSNGILRFSSSDVTNQAADKKTPEKEENIKKNIVVEKLGSITTLNINRQQTRNSLDSDTLVQLCDAIDNFNKDKDALVLVLNGECGSFCSGFDMKEMRDKGYNHLKDAAIRLLKRPISDKPTIAAVSGYAVAEGFELALACDLRVIEDTAVLGCLGRRFGVPQSLYGGRRLTSLIGLSRALDLLITGRQISGVEADKLGLAAKLTSTGTALGESIKLAKSIAKFPQSALMMDKLAAIFCQLNPNDEETMRDEALMNSLLGAAVEDMKTGLQKFEEGIGKHGKCYQLKEICFKPWESEEKKEDVCAALKPKKKD